MCNCKGYSFILPPPRFPPDLRGQIRLGGMVDRFPWIHGDISLPPLSLRLRLRLLHFFLILLAKSFLSWKIDIDMEWMRREEKRERSTIVDSGSSRWFDGGG